MSEASHPVRRPRRWPWAVALGCAAILAGAVVGAGVAWPLALLAELSAQGACLTGGLVVVALLRRRWGVALVLLACCAVHGAYLLQPRAARSSGAPGVRLLIHNAHTSSPDVATLLRRLYSSDADVLVLVEPDAELVRTLSRDRPLAGSHPHLLMRGPTPGATSWRLVLSRWPVEDRRTHDELICVVNAPAGRFGLIAMHPASPRTARRWRQGGQLVREVADAARLLAAESLPVVIAGDLNSTPTGWRDRQLRARAPVRRCKPLQVLAGTFPASLPAPLRLALDDAWVSGEWGVCAWRLGPAAGSDHASVEIGLRLRE